jgi:hypothetical protein
MSRNELRPSSLLAKTDVMLHADAPGDPSDAADDGGGRDLPRPRRPGMTCGADRCKKDAIDSWPDAGEPDDRASVGAAGDKWYGAGRAGTMRASLALRVARTCSCSC